MSSVAAMPVSRSVWAPWTDKKGRLHPLRATVFTLLLLPGIWLAFRYANGMLGPRALNELIHGTGYWAAWFLLTSLMISPAKAVLGLPNIVVVRRMIGNAAWIYAGIHLLLYSTDQKWQLPHIASEIVLRFYLTIGFLTFLGLTILGVTSTDASMRKLGKRWKRLHRLVYGLAVVAVLHYALQVKADVSLPLLACGVLYWLLLWRALPVGWDRGPLALAGLTVVASLLTLLTEWAWYRFGTKIDPMKVLRSELDIGFGLRPTGQVFVLGLLVLAVTQLRGAAQGRAGHTALFWVALYSLGAWVDDAVSFLLGLYWGEDAEPFYWVMQNLAWAALLGLLGFVRWLLRDSGNRRVIDALAIGCVLYQVVLAWSGARSVEIGFASILATIWGILAWQTWHVSRLAAALLVPLGVLLAYGVAGLL